MVKAIASLTENRLPVLANLASAHEQGGFDRFRQILFCYAIFRPKGTSTAVVQKLHDAAVAAVNIPAVRSRLNELGFNVVAPERQSPEYLQKFVEREIENGSMKISLHQVPKPRRRPDTSRQ